MHCNPILQPNISPDALRNVLNSYTAVFSYFFFFYTTWWEHYNSTFFSYIIRRKLSRSIIFRTEITIFFILLIIMGTFQLMCYPLIYFLLFRFTVVSQSENVIILTSVLSLQKNDYLRMQKELASLMGSFKTFYLNLSKYVIFIACFLLPWSKFPRQCAKRVGVTIWQGWCNFQYLAIPFSKILSLERRQCS